MRDAIVRRVCGGHQRGEFHEGFDRDEDRTCRQRRTRHAISHPDRDCGCALIVLAEPHLATLSHAALHDNRLAVQRMPGIVNGYVLSVVGRM
jgi:hypothetical protein